MGMPFMCEITLNDYLIGIPLTLLRKMVLFFFLFVEEVYLHDYVYL